MCWLGLNRYSYSKCREILEDLNAFWVTISGTINLNKIIVCQLKCKRNMLNDIFSLSCPYQLPCTVSWWQSSSLVYILDQHFNGEHHHQCICLAKVASNYMRLLGVSSFCPCVTDKANGIKRMCSHEISNKLQQSGQKSRCPCDWGRITTSVWWSLIWIWRGWGLNVIPHSLLQCDWLAMGNNLCLSWDNIYLSVPRWFLAIIMGTKYQLEKYPCPKYHSKPN